LELHPGLIIAAIGLVALQTALILVLLLERRRRHNAEVEARRRMSELAHMNRAATAAELSASIAHELNQPLGAILTNTETAEIILNSSSPNLADIKEILVDIRRDDQRASEIIRRLRGLLKKTAFDIQNIDLNDVVREVLDFLAVQASARGVTLVSALTPDKLPVSADRLQLQQVILNLAVNGMEAMNGRDSGQRRLVGRTARSEGASAEFSISDSGPGIPQDGLTRVFEPFFTTKKQGMGMGLSIARTIVEAHGGRIWAENASAGGAVFCFSLPLAGAAAE
jgi:signal transduction histidine kinase